MTVVDDRATLAVVENSAAFQSLSRLARPVVIAYNRSVCASLIRASLGSWQRSHRSERLRAGGTGLATAAVVHVALTAAFGDPHGWLWLVIPGTALCIAGLLMAAASAATAGGRQL